MVSLWFPSCFPLEVWGMEKGCFQDGNPMEVCCKLVVSMWFPLCFPLREIDFLTQCGPPTMAAALEVEVIISDCLLTMPGALDYMAEFVMLEILFQSLPFLSAVLLSILLSDKKNTFCHFFWNASVHIYSGSGRQLMYCCIRSWLFRRSAYRSTSKGPNFIDLFEDTLIQYLIDWGFHLSTLQVCLNVKSPR